MRAAIHRGLNINHAHFLRREVNVQRPGLRAEMIMKTLKITWLSCDSCDGGNQPGSFISVTTEKGCGFRLYEGDKAECPCCGATGVIDADGESAWVEWDEVAS